MLKKQLIKSILKDIKSISGADCSVWDMDASCIAYEGYDAYAFEDAVKQFINTEASEKEELFFGNEAFLLVTDDSFPVYVLHLKGEGSDLSLTGKMAVSQFKNIISAVRGRTDKNQFIRDLLQNEISAEQALPLAKKLRIDLNIPRIVLLIEPKNKNTGLIVETAKGLVAQGSDDFVLDLPDGHVVILKSLRTKEGYVETEKFARVLADTLEAETLVPVRISYGMTAKELKDVIYSYDEAKAAMEIGRVFYDDKTVVSYKSLGIGRLIHQLPESVCRLFMDEALGGAKADVLDNESMITLYAFFDNNLNISETARHLFIHRNTLSYRLDKIQKKTGLDVRIFEDAMTFKLAMMVGAHLRHLSEVGRVDEY